MTSRPVLCLLSIGVLAALIANNGWAAEVPNQSKRGPEFPPLPPPTLTNVSYGPHERQVLDFWRAEANRPTPLLFIIHGGSWTSRDKASINTSYSIDKLRKAGISVVSINYRYTTQAQEAGIMPPVRAPLHDAARALQFVRSRAVEWNIDKNRVAASGPSAGGCSSLWLAFHPDLADPKSSDPVARESTRVMCVAVISAQTSLDPREMKEWIPNIDYGAHAFGLPTFAQFLAERERLLLWIAEYSPYALLTADDPPVYLSYPSPPTLGREAPNPTHATHFGTKLQEKCQRLGVECELVYQGLSLVKHATVEDSVIEKLKASPPHREYGPSKYEVPTGLVPGGAFIDRIQPMPVERGLRSDVWGGANVKPRNADNGLEDPAWSYWCMSVLPGPDGKEHMFASRWPEKSPKGHTTWPQSELVHAVADRPTGPFVVKQEIGMGHNVMCYRAKNGTYVIYCIGQAYTATSLDGPWAPYKLEYDFRGAPRFGLANLTFTQRADGSYLMVSKQGHVWVSEDGIKPYKRLTSKSLYPPIDGRFEDPVVWRDDVQYNLVVNDWFGRTAYYLRSKDGVNWVWDAGKAYDTDVVRHPDGTKEGWFKLERPNVRQDSLGRATHIYFAVIDCLKQEDKGGDEHSSKIVALPLAIPRRLQVLNDRLVGAVSEEIRVAIKAEEGFDPSAMVEVGSLRFGAPNSVDFGRGARPVKSERSGQDLIVSFHGAGTDLKENDFAAKLLGKTTGGDLLLGYARLPGQTELGPILVSRAPQLSPQTDGGLALSVLIENFGQVKSGATLLEVVFKEAERVVHSVVATIPDIAPYQSATVTASVGAGVLRSNKAYEVDAVIGTGPARTERHWVQVP